MNPKLIPAVWRNSEFARALVRAGARPPVRPCACLAARLAARLAAFPPVVPGAVPLPLPPQSLSRASLELCPAKSYSSPPLTMSDAPQTGKKLRNKKRGRKNAEGDDATGLNEVYVSNPHAPLFPGMLALGMATDPDSIVKHRLQYAS